MHRSRFSQSKHARDSTEFQGLRFIPKFCKSTTEDRLKFYLRLQETHFLNVEIHNRSHIGRDFRQQHPESPGLRALRR